jgi:hypothetical protein
LAALALALAPGLAPAQSQQFVQQYAPADPQLPIPLGSTRPEDGGFYTYGKALLYRQSNPLREQLVAVRGLFAYDTGGQQVLVSVPAFRPVIPGTSIPALLPGDVPDPSHDTTAPPGGGGGTQVINGLVITFPPIITGGVPMVQGQFVINNSVQQLPGLFTQPGFAGSGQTALDVDNLRTRNPYQPGFELGVGWKFGDGSAVYLSWLYLTEVQHRAAATLAPPAGFNPPGVNVDPNLTQTFLFAPVYNFPPEFAGADFKVNVPTGAISAVLRNGAPLPIRLNPQTVFGIWNGASIMTIEFRQRFQQWEMGYREPVWETETYRLSGLVGPRFSWLWEKFKWTTTSIGQQPDGTIISGPEFVGIYSNITSNRMYGLHAGCEQEWYLGRGFALTLKTEGALFVDSAKEYSKYERAAKHMGPENKLDKIEWAFVPELQASLGLMWYPTEFIQIYAGYDAFSFFNTRASPRPIDFNYGGLNPRWTHVDRFFDGWAAGLAFTF